jgi:nucleoside phosphorylase
VSRSPLPCFAFALAREHAPFRKAAGILDPVEGVERCWRGERGLVVETGFGAACVRRALDAVDARFAPARYLFAGFAGALDDRLRSAEVRAASFVIGADGARRRPTWAVPGLEAVPLFTSSRIVGEPEAKRALGAELGAALVDMESAPFADWCKERGAPWACVRAVSDEVDTRLSPELLSMMAAGRVSIGGVLRVLLRHPALVGEMWRLGRDTKRAAHALAAALARTLGCA